MSIREEVKSMFDISVKGAVSLISRQVTQVENNVDGEVPCQVTVNPSFEKKLLSRN
jgi:hypothetical protein